MLKSMNVVSLRAQDVKKGDTLLYLGEPYLEVWKVQRHRSHGRGYITIWDRWGVGNTYDPRERLEVSR